ncbi:MAG: hypothetical protein D3923_17355 [Candidatus Electrothrix sp. AR3]|nr:hypothetical protein [Candidatus Electrothrix sp. AR3]
MMLSILMTSAVNQSIKIYRLFWDCWDHPSSFGASLRIFQKISSPFLVHVVGAGPVSARYARANTGGHPYGTRYNG